MKKKKYSDSHLQTLWREAIREKYDHACAICGDVRSLEAHHIVHRRALVLRHDVRNGILLCHACHNIADTLEGRDQIRRIIGESDYTYIMAAEKLTIKDVTSARGITRLEWDIEQIKKLKSID